MGDRIGEGGFATVSVGQDPISACGVSGHFCGTGSFVDPHQRWITLRIFGALPRISEIESVGKFDLGGVINAYETRLAAAAAATPAACIAMRRAGRTTAIER